MKILVCISYVPDTTSKISFKENNTKFNSDGVQYIIGPYDDYALARAVEIKENTGSSISVLNVGKSETEVVLRKALAIGADVKKIEEVKKYDFTKDLIDNFFKNGRSSYAEGLGSLYTYERQVPEIADTKIRGLKNHYGVNSKEGLEFFEVHKKADVYHREACEKLLDGLSKEEKDKAEKAALSTAKYLWNFLSGMASKHNLQAAA